MRKLTPTTKTTRGNQDGKSLADAFHRDWDKPAGAQQAMERSAKRIAEGQKKTPIGAGKLKRK